MINYDTITEGSLLDLLPLLQDNSVNAVITSPPYAQQRKKSYGGIDEDLYPEWTVQWMELLRPKLVNDGNVAIVIRPHVSDGQISDYVLQTRLAIRKAGWKEIEELIWIKPTAAPLGSIKRPRRSWESILWFSKTSNPYCDTQANGQYSDRIGLESSKGLGDYIAGVSASGKGIARCKDYIEVGTHETHKETYNTHPAQYPEKLVNWLIELLCPPKGVVCDPFAGSGTTLLAAKKKNRPYIGMELNPDYITIANRRLAAVYSSDDMFSF